jgi:hypothetical protein
VIQWDRARPGKEDLVVGTTVFADVLSLGFAAFWRVLVALLVVTGLRAKDLV